MSLKSDKRTTNTDAIKALENKARVAEQRAGALQGEIEGLKAKLKTAEDAKTAAEKKVQDVEATRARSATAASVAAENGLNTLKGQIDDLTTRLNHAEAAKTTAEEGAKTEKTARTAAETAKTEADKKVLTLQGEIDSLKAKLNSAEAAVAEKPQASSSTPPIAPTPPPGTSSSVLTGQHEQPKPHAFIPVRSATPSPLTLEERHEAPAASKDTTTVPNLDSIVFTNSICNEPKDAYLNQVKAAAKANKVPAILSVIDKLMCNTPAPCVADKNDVVTLLPMGQFKTKFAGNCVMYGIEQARHKVSGSIGNYTKESLNETAYKQNDDLCLQPGDEHVYSAAQVVGILVDECVAQGGCLLSTD